MSKLRKYERAWDIIDRTWKTPEDISYDIMHDRPRFISEKPNNMGDGGYILTYYKGTTRKYKNGKKSKVRAHFKVLKTFSLNTYENRQRLEEQEAGRESDVHKLCKQLFIDNKINDIHVESIKVPIVIGNDTTYIEIPEQRIKVVSIEGVELRDNSSNRIPDITINAEICGVVQQFFIEIYYRHPVDQTKKYMYTSNRLNCLEVDIGNIYEDLKTNDTEELKETLKEHIENNAHWISCRFRELVKAAINTNYNIINTSTTLRNSGHPVLNKFNRAFIFEDTLRLNGDNRVTKKAHNIGDCVTCNRCIGIKGYYSDDTDDIEVTCSINDIQPDMSHEQKVNMAVSRIKDWVSKNM